MDHATYLGWMAGAMSRFADLIGRADLDRHVPPCPEWDVAALVEHVVGVHKWVGRILETGGPSPAADLPLPPRTSTAYAHWYAEAAAELRDALGGVDPDGPCWNFSGVNQTNAFWPRRQAHEVSVHAVDAALAAGTAHELDPALAADGIDELLTVFGPRMAKRGQPPRVAAGLMIRPTDSERVWTLRPPSGSEWAIVTAGRRDDTAHGVVATLEGTSADLYLAMWSRLPVERIAITGDADVAATYLQSPLTP